MAKEPTEPLSNLDLSVKIVPLAIDQEDLNSFSQAVLKAKYEQKEPPTIIEHLKNKYQKDLEKYPKDIVIVPTLYGEVEGLDFSNVDFTGIKFKDAGFKFCKFQNASFCDSDLKNVTFYDCELQNADMRGADLSTVRFEGYEEKELDKLDGIKFSTTKELLDGYVQDNESAKEKQRNEFKDRKAQEILDLEKRYKESAPLKQEEIKKINEALNAEYGKLSWQQAAWVNTGFNSGNVEYDNLASKKKQLEEELDRSKNELAANKKKLEDGIDKGLPDSKIKYEFSPSLLKVIERKGVYDPAYPRGASELERQQKRCYIKLTCEDVEKYLAELKNDKDLKINDFAKKLATDRGIQIPNGEVVIADLSPRYNQNYTLEEVDLSTLDFTGANLQNACFSGAILRECNFTDANLQGASFESADFLKATFHNTDAKDANFYHCNLGKAKIEKSNFRRAFMRASDAPKVDISDSNFDFTNVRNGNWREAKIEDATFNYADMEGVSLAKADLKRVQMQHAILNNAVMEECKIIESDLQKAYLEGVNAKKAEIKKSNLEQIKAKEIDFTEAELKELSVEGADLRGAVIRKMHAELINCKNANMSQIQAEGAILQEAILENANLRFAKLKNAALDKAKAEGVDMSGAFMDGMHAHEANFKGAILKDVQAVGVDFTGSDLTEADLQNADLESTILKNVKLVEANLQGVGMHNADIEKADLHKAEVDAAAEFDVKNREKAKDNSMLFVHEDGEVENFKPLKLAEKQKEIKKEEAKNPILSEAAKKVQEGTSFSRKAVEWIKKGFQGKRKKYARILGGTAGATIAGIIAVVACVAFAASIPLTGGASLAVAAAVVVGAVAVGAATGAVAGHFLADNTFTTAFSFGTTSTFGAIVGGMLGGIPGAVMGWFAGAKVNQIAKVDDLVAKGANKALDKVDEVAEQFKINPDLAKDIEERKAAEKRHAEEKILKEPLGQGVDIDLARIKAEAKAKENKEGKPLDVQPRKEAIAKVKDNIASVEKPTVTEKINDSIKKLETYANTYVDKAASKLETLKAQTQEKPQANDPKKTIITRTTSQPNI